MNHQSTKNYQRLSILAGFILLVLVALQVFWLSKAISFQAEEGRQRLSRLVNDLAISINSIGHDYFHGSSVRLQDVPASEVDSVVESFIVTNDLSKDLSFAIFQDSLGASFISNDAASLSELRSSEIKSCISCIVSFGTVKDKVEREPKESDTSYSNRLRSATEFMYFSPLANAETDSKTVWVALYDRSLFSQSLVSLLWLFVVNLLMLLALLYLFYQLMNALAKHKKSAKAKEEFFNSMTHEFKTPLASIRLASKVLRESNDADKNKSYHAIIEKESVALETQVDKLLQLSLIDEQEIAIQKEKVNLKILLMDIKHRMSPLVLSKKGSLEIDCPNHEITLVGDRHLLFQALANLVENSLKYGGINPHIIISLKERATGILLKVKDNGPGIEKEHQPYIFDRFYRANSGNKYKGRGFGIGLSYVKAVIEAHQGTISLEKTHGQGCSFLINL